jgi:N-acetyl-gamma-glutamyl-phosphate reductase
MYYYTPPDEMQGFLARRMMIKAAIIGVTGYAGIELLRLLELHPEVKVIQVFTESYSGQAITAVYPHLVGLTKLQGKKFSAECVAELVQEKCDLVFIALPHTHAINITPALLSAGLKVIDLGSDFRLKNPKDYEAWYEHPPATEALLSKAVYGLPEKGNKEAIKNATLLANPGCYPTASLLAALPALKAGIIELNDFIFDAKSGVSGAGRTASLNSHHCEITENLIPYKLAGAHRHTPEIEQELSVAAGAPITIQFTPQLVPLIRGLLVTAYFKLKKPLSANEVHEIYQTYYKNEPFVRLSPLHIIPQLKQVRGTNYCDIGIQVDTRTGRLIVVSVIDNLIKGAAGQAIQNMNLMHQLPETTGLYKFYATYP